MLPNRRGFELHRYSYFQFWYFCGVTTVLCTSCSLRKFKTLILIYTSLIKDEYLGIHFLKDFSNGVATRLRHRRVFNALHVV